MQSPKGYDKRLRQRQPQAMRNKQNLSLSLRFFLSWPTPNKHGTQPLKSVYDAMHKEEKRASELFPLPLLSSFSFFYIHFFSSMNRMNET